jgi:hypothetical protein
VFEGDFFTRNATDGYATTCFDSINRANAIDIAGQRHEQVFAAIATLIAGPGSNSMGTKLVCPTSGHFSPPKTTSATLSRRRPSR